MDLLNFRQGGVAEGSGLDPGEGLISGEKLRDGHKSSPARMRPILTPTFAASLEQWVHRLNCMCWFCPFAQRVMDSIARERNHI
ncbi:hypothetical protein ScPMuIL_016233 [Solemya velum]